MENASKALLMAAGVLLGIMLLSLAVYLIVTFGSQSAEMHKQIETDRLNQFNTQFTSYEGKQCTIYDVITVANLATENNRYYELPRIAPTTNATGNDMYIQVRLKKNGSSNFINIEYGYNSTVDISEENQDMIKQDINKVAKGNDTTEKLPTYKCTVKISDITQRVYQASFEQ